MSTENAIEIPSGSEIKNQTHPDGVASSSTATDQADAISVKKVTFFSMLFMQFKFFVGFMEIVAVKISFEDYPAEYEQLRFEENICPRNAWPGTVGSERISVEVYFDELGHARVSYIAFVFGRRIDLFTGEQIRHFFARTVFDYYFCRCCKRWCALCSH